MSGQISNDMAQCLLIVVSRRRARRNAFLCQGKQPSCHNQQAALPNGKKHEHQYRIPQAALREVERQLQAAANRLANAADFTALHQMVDEEIGEILGIRALTVYDVAHRVYRCA